MDVSNNDLKPFIRSRRPQDEIAFDPKLPDQGTPLSPAECMQLATDVAFLGVGQVSLNPLVGAVFVDRDHRFLSAGAYLKYGGPHAEIEALRQLPDPDELLRDATLYVTLEPCSFVGKTAACTTTLSTLPLQKVICAAIDPHPRVCGHGVSLLQNAGIECVVDPTFEIIAAPLNESFLWSMRNQRPYVGLKAAVTLNEVMARHGDRRQWITGERARQYGHYLRLFYDGVIVGSNTVLLDNPSLDCRHRWLNSRSPWRIVLDPQGEVMQSPDVRALKLLQHGPDKVVWVTGASALPAILLDHGVKYLQLSLDAKGLFVLDELLESLFAFDIRSILLEGGSQVYGSFLNADLVQKLHLFQAPKIFEGGEVIKWTKSLDVSKKIELQQLEVTLLDPDWVTEAQVKVSSF